MPKPVCPTCQRFYKCVKTGIYWTESMPIGEGALPGNLAPKKWHPYKIWSGDMYECDGFNNKIIDGKEPVNEHFRDGFLEDQQSLEADKIIINDC